MNNRMIRGTALFSLLYVVPADAALTLTVEVKDHEKHRVQTHTWKLDGSRFRTESSNNRAKTIVIFDANTDKFFKISPAQKVYWELEGRQIQAIEMADKESNAPEPRRPSEDSRQFVPLNRALTIAGYHCQTYRVLEENKAVEEVCLSEWSNKRFQAEEFGTMDRLEKLLSILAHGQRSPAVPPNISRGPGFPLVRVMLDSDGKPTHTATVKSIQRGSLPNALFELPPGYTKQAIP